MLTTHLSRSRANAIATEVDVVASGRYGWSHLHDTKQIGSMPPFNMAIMKSCLMGNDDDPLWGEDLTNVTFDEINIVINIMRKKRLIRKDRKGFWHMTNREWNRFNGRRWWECSLKSQIRPWLRDLFNLA